MGSLEEQEAANTPTLKLPLLPLKSHVVERSNFLASPIHCLASVPFSWEEEPGKPKPCTTLTTTTTTTTITTLELPPRLQVEKDARGITKQPSPTTVLDGPYSMGRSRRFESPSFRNMVMGSDCYGSFRSDIINSPVYDDEIEEENNQKVGALVVSRKRGRFGFVGLWKKRASRGKGDFGRGSYVFPSSVDRESESSSRTGEESSNGVKMTRFTRAGSFSNLAASRPHFWATVYEGLKHVVPWKSKSKSKSKV